MADLQYEGLSDSELAAAFNAGDDTAFAWLYDRYFHPIYDFAVRTVRDADVAADVVQNTFVKAWEAMRKGKGGANVKAWLYAIARNDAIDELRRRQRQVLAGELSDEKGRLPSFVELDQSRLSQPDEVSQDQEMIDLVWSSAESLDSKGYTLLDLHVRRGLSTDELSECLGVSKGNVYTMLSRLRDSLESAVVTTLLIRRGRRDCPELSRITGGRMTGEASPDLRHDVKQHLEGCERCQENRRRFASPLEIFGGFAMVPAAPGIKESIWGNIGARLAEGPPPREPSSPRLPAEMSWARIPMEMRLAIGGVVGAILVALLLVLLVSSGGGGGGFDDPDDVRSTSHEIGEASSVASVRMRWTPEPEARGYSVEWSRLPVDLPDATADLPGDADSAESRPLFPGSWYFHMRTQGEDGSWTSTVHVGPFVIVQTGGPTPKPTATPEETDEPTQTPEPTAETTETPTPAPAETATPSPTPATATPTPASSPTPSPVPPPDTDADGFPDAIESLYGSDPNDQTSTPENGQYDIATGAGTCTDTIDNDRNGLTDSLDPKCP